MSTRRPWCASTYIDGCHRPPIGAIRTGLPSPRIDAPRRAAVLASADGSSDSGPLEQLLHGGDEVFHVQRLALVRVEAGVHDLLPVLGHHRRGDRHDPNRARGYVGPAPSESLDPVDPTKPDVNEGQT